MSGLAINTIHNIDCIDGLKKIPKNTVDVIITSPPYNLGINYSEYNDDKPREEYLNWIENISKLCKNVLTDDGSFFLNIGGSLKDPWIPLDVAQRLRKNFTLQNTIHWVKSIAIPKIDVENNKKILGDIAVGHYKPINSKRFHHDCHEYIFHFTKKGDVFLDKTSIGVPYQDKSNIKRWKCTNGVDKRDRGNTWFIPYETIQEARPHPCIYPTKLPELCIMDHGLESTKLVLDPFMGAGSTALAAMKLNVNFIGFEIDQRYIEIANDRMKQAEWKDVPHLQRITNKHQTKGRETTLCAFT